MTMPLNLTPSEAERWTYANGDAQHALHAKLASLHDANDGLCVLVEELQNERDWLLLGEDA